MFPRRAGCFGPGISSLKRLRDDTGCTPQRPRPSSAAAAETVHACASRSFLKTNTMHVLAWRNGRAAATLPPPQLQPWHGAPATGLIGSLMKSRGLGDIISGSPEPPWATWQRLPASLLGKRVTVSDGQTAAGGGRLAGKN